MTAASIVSAPFFQHDGTLSARNPSYVSRNADEELLDHLRNSQFCYVLTSRQMGKSSLMVRTAARLSALDTCSVIVDLTIIGTRISADEWYFGIVSTLANALDLDIDISAWWGERGALAPVQRFNNFIETVVLEQVQRKIVIFLDEIDSTLALDFTDDFFAAIRAIYNRRASNPIFNRLTFVLLGVASPDDLIKDRARTPFNIGKAIRLREFTLAEAEPLRVGLAECFGAQAERLLKAIFGWTSGHPYLTQKLCARLVAQPERRWDEQQIADLVAAEFLRPDFNADSNLTSMHDMVAAEPAPERRALLELYRQVYRGDSVRENELSPIQNRLKLIGLVRAEGGALVVRNRIYRQVFGPAWTRANTPVNWRGRLALALALSALLAVALLFLGMRWQDERARVAQFQTLSRNCAGSVDGAQEVFFSKPPEEQRDIFQVRIGQGGVAPEAFAAAVECLAPGLQQPERLALRDAICCRLGQLPASEQARLGALGCSGGCGEPR